MPPDSSRPQIALYHICLVVLSGLVQSSRLHLDIYRNVYSMNLCGCTYRVHENGGYYYISGEVGLSIAINIRLSVSRNEVFTSSWQMSPIHKALGTTEMTQGRVQGHLKHYYAPQRKFIWSIWNMLQIYSQM